MHIHLVFPVLLDSLLTFMSMYINMNNIWLKSRIAARQLFADALSKYLEDTGNICMYTVFMTTLYYTYIKPYIHFKTPF